MEELLADRAYSSRENLDYADKLGAAPYIPFKKNSTGNSNGSQMWRKMFYYFQMNQDDFMASYHKRSNIESTFWAIKKKFGENLKSKSRTAQINELLCKIVAYNITVVIQEMFELGIKPQFK